MRKNKFFIISVWVILIIVIIIIAHIAAGDIWCASATGDMTKLKVLLTFNPTLARKTDDKGNTPLHLTVSYFPEHTEAVELLISKGADVNAMSNSGDTPLVYAARNGFKKIVILFLKKGANPNIGNSPLHSALEHSHNNNLIRKEIIEILISSGVNVNMKNRDGKTPLEMAIFGINEDKECSEGDKLYKERVKKYQEIVELLRKHGAK